MKKRILAFTLAEILITLSVIGIVASLTIPVVIASYQKRLYIAKLKKFYTTFNQALTQVAADHGCPGSLACTGLFKPGTDNLSLGNELVKYFKVAKNCKTDHNKGCFADKSLRLYDGSGLNEYSSNDLTAYYKFITADNMSISIMNYTWNSPSNSNCKYSGFSRNMTGHLKQYCGVVWVDVNGLQKPNIEGRDTFYFYISNGKGPLLYPFAGYDDVRYWKLSNPNKCTPANAYGEYCAARIMEEGWEMNY